MSTFQGIVVSVEILTPRCSMNLLKAISNVEGICIKSIDLDATKNKITINGDADQVDIMREINKFQTSARLISSGPLITMEKIIKKKIKNYSEAVISVEILTPNDSTNLLKAIFSIEGINFIDINATDKIEYINTQKIVTLYCDAYPITIVREIEKFGISANLIRYRPSRKIQKEREKEDRISRKMKKKIMKNSVVPYEV